MATNLDTIHSSIKRITTRVGLTANIELLLSNGDKNAIQINPHLMHAAQTTLEPSRIKREKSVRRTNFRIKYDETTP